MKCTTKKKCPLDITVDRAVMLVKEEQVTTVDTKNVNGSVINHRTASTVTVIKRSDLFSFRFGL